MGAVYLLVCSLYPSIVLCVWAGLVFAYDVVLFVDSGLVSDRGVVLFVGAGFVSAYGVVSSSGRDLYSIMVSFCS